MIQKHLLDVNVLIALTEPAHGRHQAAQKWFHSDRRGTWAICPLTEAGFIRVTTNPAFYPVPRSIEQCAAVLKMLRAYPEYSYWPIENDWVTLTAPFVARISGHQQVTDAHLLGLAIKHEGVLVTFDRGLKFLARNQFARNLLVLET